MGDVSGPGLATSPQDPSPFIHLVIKRRYRVTRKLAGGPIGTLYLAEDLTARNKVVVNVLRSEFAEDKQFVATFNLQAHQLAALCNESDAIVKVHECGHADERTLFIAMEHVDGMSLSELIQQEGALNVKRALRLAIQIGEGLEAAHSVGLIHGALTPQNVIVLAKDVVKLMGFETAGLRHTAAMKRLASIGATPLEYMTPEQITAAEITERTDVYAFGIVLYQMLCGVVPFSASEPNVVRAKHLYKAPAPPRRLRRDVPSSVERILMQALEKRPERRPDMTAVLHDLRAADRQLKDRLISTKVTAQALFGPVQDVRTSSTLFITNWKLVGACALLVLIAAPATWMALSQKDSESHYTSGLQQRSDRGAAGVAPPPTLSPPEKKGPEPGNVSEAEPVKALQVQSSTAPVERPPVYLSSPQSPPEKKATPIVPSREQANAGQRARTAAPTPTRSDPGEAADASDPSDPTAVIDWLLKEYSARKR